MKNSKLKNVLAVLASSYLYFTVVPAYADGYVCGIVGHIVKIWGNIPAGDPYAFGIALRDDTNGKISYYTTQGRSDLKDHVVARVVYSAVLTAYSTQSSVQAVVHDYDQCNGTKSIANIDWHTTLDGLVLSTAP